MSLRYQWFITQSEGLRERAKHSAVSQGVTVNPDWWVGVNISRLAAQPGWADRWKKSWEANHASRDDYDPGWDESAITDSMIDAAVKKLISENTAIEERKKAEEKAELEREYAKSLEEDQRRREEQIQDDITRAELYAIAASEAETIEQEDAESSRRPKDRAGRYRPVFDRIRSNVKVHRNDRRVR